MLEHHLAEHLAVGARPWVGASHEHSEAAAHNAERSPQFGETARNTPTYLLTGRPRAPAAASVASMNLVTLLWTGVAAFRQRWVGDKHASADVSVPRLAGFSLITCTSPPSPSPPPPPQRALGARRVRWSPPRFGQARRASETRSAAISPAAPVPCGPKGNDPMIESLVIIGLFLVPLATTRSKDGRSCT